MMNSKKASGIPMEVIVWAAVGLGVLIVIFIILTSSSSKFYKDTLSCESKRGQCVAAGQCSAIISSYNCPTKEMPVCCISPG